ncbi:glycosyltransferase [Hyphobacterium sp.]|uniref:glycosyltransferase n=1 Tax=Hyphobacterium sp. TaxID=2004662 RepID=UPI003B5242AD
MSNHIPISIVTPNYNGAQFLRECMESVLGQQYPALQYVISDGASTDGSRLIFEHYRRELAGLTSEPDEGHADAVNKGFAMTDGEIMGWINSDDILHPGCLSQVARIFETHPEVEWITGRPSTMNVRSEIDYVGPVRPWSRLRFLAGDHLWIQQESTFWRRSLWERAGGGLDTAFDVANDFELWMRFFRHADLYTVDRMLGCFRVRPGQRSVDQLDHYKQEMRTVIQRELDSLDPEFRDSFGDLIPARPRELTDAEREDLDEQLRVLDPPTIRMSAVRRRADFGKATGGKRFSSGLRAPEPISDLAALKDRHQGERCVILGNGPSLNKTDLGLLKNETVFACNAVHLLFDRIDWRPSYYTCVDSQVLPDRASDIETMLATHPDMVAFFPAEVQTHGGDRRRLKGRDLVSDGPNRYFFNEVAGTIDDLPESMFSLDAAEKVIQPHTVAITMLQLAAHLGFSEIVLVGFDMRYVMPASARPEDESAPNDPRLTSLANDDANHFDPTYFGAGRKWHTPNTMLMREHFEIARQALTRAGVRVINATEGGDLEVFERKDLAEALRRPPSKARQPVPSAGEPRPAEAETLPPTGLRRVLGELIPSVRRNWTFIAGVMLVFAAIVASAILLPEWRVWIALLGLFATTLAFSIAVAIKSRRILTSVLVALKERQSGKAEAELALQVLEQEIDALYAELHEVRRERSRRDVA